jgi:hypothetical protein
MLHLLLLFILVLWISTSNGSCEVENSKHFYVSAGASKKVYSQMRDDGVPKERLQTFVRLEDEFLQLEKESVCLGIPRIVPATIISNKIKDLFSEYNFSYHTIHLKQIAEPNKLVNSNIRC